MADPIERGGIGVKNLSTALRNRIFGSASQKDRIVMFPGMKAHNLLRVASDVVDGQTVTIGADTYIVDIINTDTSANTASNQWNNVLKCISVTVAAHGRVAGDLLRVENEMVKVLRVVDANTVVVIRGRCGTTIAAHADGLDIFKSDGVHATAIPVGLVTTLTPTAFTPALVDEINNPAEGGERATAKASTIYDPGTTATAAQRANKVVAEAISVNEVVITSALPEACVLACTETLAGANNAWSAVTMYQGAAPTLGKVIGIAHVPTAVEVELDHFYVDLDFTPSWVEVIVRTTATGIIVAWVGGVLISTNRITINNAGGTDWAATDTVYVIAGGY
jgi:hypothetical protein